jgi:hypothetical protein
MDSTMDKQIHYKLQITGNNQNPDNVNMFDISGKELNSSNFNSFSIPGASGPISRISPFRNPVTGRSIAFGSFDVNNEKV